MIDREINLAAPCYKDFNEIMDDYNSGDEKRIRQAKADACENLKRYIIYIITHNYRSYCNNNFYDMLQQGYMGVINSLGKYDPEKAMPTTYFKKHIISEIYRYITGFVNHTTVHYADVARRADEAIRYFESEGIPYDIDILAEYTGISPKSIKNALDIKEASVSVSFYDEYGKDSDSVLSVTSREDNPERYVEKKELNETVWEAVDCLPDIEKSIIKMHFGFDSEKMSFKEIADALGYSVSEVEDYFYCAVGDLKNSKIRQLFPEKYASEDWISEEIEFIPEQKETVVEYVSFNDFVAGDDD